MDKEGVKTDRDMEGAPLGPVKPEGQGSSRTIGQRIKGALYSVLCHVNPENLTPIDPETYVGTELLTIKRLVRLSILGGSPFTTIFTGALDASRLPENGVVTLKPRLTPAGMAGKEINRQLSKGLVDPAYVKKLKIEALAELHRRWDEEDRRLDKRDGQEAI